MRKIAEIIQAETFEASAPCRIDMGGTFDLSTFFLPLRTLQPCTFNAAIDLRTRIRLMPFEKGKIRITSLGFDELVVDSTTAPFNHPLGLMLAVAAYFDADGVAIDIQSASPPRSALGGSSVAAVALIWSFFKALAIEGKPMPKKSFVARLAHAIEQSVAGLPCGQQDQLAAVYGGVHAWEWKAEPDQLGFGRRMLIPREGCKDFSRCVLVAYCGQPHASKDINGTWVRQFVRGDHRDLWHSMVHLGHRFVEAIADGDFPTAQDTMNEETRLRRQLTPDVLDEVGTQLVEIAVTKGCGARFTGAGGGGCIWALGYPEQIVDLKSAWQQIVQQSLGACLLDTAIDTIGVL